MAIPKVFISYSHDSQEHKQWVLDLATRLRNHGVDAIIDQWELRPGDDLPHFMETHLSTSDYVLMVCTEKYVEKANMGKGGVGYEKMIVTADLLANIDSNKVIPIIRQAGTKQVPTFLKTKLFIDFSQVNEFEFSFDELVRTLHGSPLFKKPDIGNNPFVPVENLRPDKTADSLRELMGFIVDDFENGDDYTWYKSLVRRMNISRIYLDDIIATAFEQGLIEYDYMERIVLTSKGKFYAVEHKLIRA
ncbi:toll/interleukin-1 receptor domain-containing protein [Tichowtungia aerotolerans]|uniref:TIR domain-containing protein n=1 Tax=Tichowtungia aerotolerans TaxID=2697043 RepID=A0A6P1M891_9BACT|nr:toll/interleukin-1 receptor domain-containing protein [Tichowtungia aerotolerans]QHI68734.1 TIR domain-containing protein [Tichowtungia aerotolerans]